MMTTENNENGSTLLHVSEEIDSLDLKYKDQLHNLKKVHDEDMKKDLNE